MITDQELIDKAKRMCLTMKGARMGMAELKGNETVRIGVESLERLTALAMLGVAVIQAHRALPGGLIGSEGHTVARFLNDLTTDWTEKTNLLVGQVTDTKTGETS
jgi:hypothetical protein